MFPKADYACALIPEAKSMSEKSFFSDHGALFLNAETGMA
jgi:hypothetical protein